MPAGRPTKYCKDILKKSRKYIDECQDKFVRQVMGVKDGKEDCKWMFKVNLPKAEGLALALKVNKDTLYEWASKYEEFSDILKEINQLQADRVINESMAGNYNPMIAKLLLGKHGYKDEIKTEHTVDIEAVKDLTNTIKGFLNK
jgi:hypothetical protein